MHIQCNSRLRNDTMRLSSQLALVHALAVLNVLVWFPIAFAIVAALEALVDFFLDDV